MIRPVLNLRMDGAATLSAGSTLDLSAGTVTMPASAFTGLDYKASVRAATTGNITLSGAQTIDGISIIAGDRVLVRAQSTTANNGIYLCASGSWTRATDFDNISEIPGAIVPVELGSTLADTVWLCTNNQTDTLGSTAIAFARFTMGIAVGATASTGTAGYVLYTDGSLVQAYAISGTGSVAMTDNPSFITPTLGAATATSINGITITAGTGTLNLGAATINTNDTGGAIDTSSFGGRISTYDGGGTIETYSSGGSIDTSQGGGSINTRGTGNIQLGHEGTRTTLLGSASGSDKTQTLPNATGTIALTSDITGGTLAGSFTTLAVNGKSLTLGANFATTGTDRPTFAFPSAATARTYTFPTTTATLARTDAAQTLTATQTISDSTDRNGAGAGASLTIQGASSVGPAFRMSTTAAGMFSVFVHATNGHTYFGTGSGSLIVTNGANSSGSTLFSVTTGGAFSIPGTLAVTGATTLTGLLTANGGITVVGGSKLLTTNTELTNYMGANSATLDNSPITGDPTKWIAIDDNGTTRYIPTWS